MLGRELRRSRRSSGRRARPLAALETATPVLEATAVGRKGAIAPFDLALHRGEVVGLAGLLGSGRTELARLLFGADRADSGQLDLDGKRGHDPQPAGRDRARHRVLPREPADARASSRT